MDTALYSQHLCSTANQDLFENAVHLGKYQNQQMMEVDTVLGLCPTVDQSLLEYLEKSQIQYVDHH